MEVGCRVAKIVIEGDSSWRNIGSFAEKLEVDFEGEAIAGHY